jgi:predicted PurR-regulated permease PerM
MAIFFIILGIILLVAAIAAPIVFVQTRKSFREQKNYERALKTVPILIHLPPSSDDIEAGGRDIRDVTEETISKGQTIYNIIAGTLQKGLRVISTANAISPLKLLGPKVLCTSTQPYRSH